MASLFYTRKLSEVFPHRNVVVESTGIRTKDDNIIFRVNVDFGSSGKLVRQTTIRAIGNDILTINKALMEYENSLLEIVDILEEFKCWVLKLVPVDSSEAVLRDYALFNQVLCEEHPLMFHAVRSAKGIAFQIFGEGLRDLEIILDTRQSVAPYRAFLLKIDEILNAFRSHLNDVERVPVAQLLQGSK